MVTHCGSVQNGSNFNSWLAISTTALLWFGSYKMVTRSLTNQTPEFCSRLIAFLHGVVAASIGMPECFSSETPFLHPEWRTTSTQSFLLVLSLGYFIYDLCWCLYYNSETKLMICHHIYSIVALYRLLRRPYYGAQAACVLGSMEVTNPLLQARWFIRTAGLYPSFLFDVTEMIFFLLFTVVRIILGGYNIVLVFAYRVHDWEVLILAITIYLLSCMFLISIVKYMCIKYGKRKMDYPFKEHPSGTKQNGSYEGENVARSSSQ